VDVRARNGTGAVQPDDTPFAERPGGERQCTVRRYGLFSRTKHPDALTDRPPALAVGFVGLGRMGQAIAGRVLGGGHDLVVHNRTRAKAAELEQAGARVAATPAAACDGREIVITMLANDDALTEVALGEGGLRDHLPAGAIHMTMGTHGVATIRGLADAHEQAGQTLVAAPVLGRPDVAATGRLGIVAGGPPDAVARCQPLFELIGRRTFHAGPRPESATAIKLANNLTLGCAIEVMGEAFSLVRKYDVEPSTFQDVLVDGLFSSPAYEVYGRIIVEEAYDNVGFTAELGLKDANLVLAAADLARLPLPSVNAWKDRLLSAIAHGHGEQDWAVVAREQSRAGGLT
jgi:3-hydroxyisobutyrate dehydrogenase-like beta-hydroxyacid dehydrogenase